MTVALAAGSFAATATTAGAEPPSASTGRLKAAVLATDSRVLLVHVDGSRARLRSTVASAATPDVTVRDTFGPTRTFSVQVPASGETAAIARLRRLDGVTSVEKSVPRHLFDAPATNDPDLGDQQRYLNAVTAPTAWRTQQGSSTVKIAILDSGIDVGHPDLAGKIVGSYDAETGGSQIVDHVGHGTFVAGVAAAATDNGVGVAGAGYNTSILGVKIAGPGGFPIDDEIAGIRWAVQHGADVINLSIGGPDSSPAEREAIENAIKQGVVVVVAAGNGSSSAKQYPAAYPGVISVGATNTSNGTRAGFSSYGPWVSVAAPGVGIFSTTPRAGSKDFATKSGYSLGNGTSFSAPIVAGEAALLKAQNPSESGAQLRAAIIASAHGYAHLGLGAGQVDFAGALGRLTPVTTPSAVTESGTADQITLTARSTAPRVAFHIDSQRSFTPVKVTNGAAHLNYSSAGLANGQHTLYAVDCNAYNSCATSTASHTFQLANSAPSITEPAQGTMSSGPFDVAASHANGGSARLLIDGHSAGFSTSSPYDFAVNGSALHDGDHSLRVTLCNSNGTICHGPTSSPWTISTESLHPHINTVSRAAISPDGNGVRDTSLLTYRLPAAQRVAIETIDAQGYVTRTARLGTQRKGVHTWTWRGQQDSGDRLRDGRYTLAVVTTRRDSGHTLHGLSAIPVTVDTHAPALTAVSAGSTTFFPVHDGYRDSFTPHVNLGGGGELDLVISNTRGKVVRTVSAHRPGGATSLSWNGRDQHGALVAPGRYRWRFTVSDAAGNRRTTSPGTIAVSGKHLVHQNLALSRKAGTAFRLIPSDPSCTSASRKSSSYPGGVLLSNSCRPRNGDYAAAAYKFDLPKARSYRSLSFEVLGRSKQRPSELTAALESTDGSGVEIPHYVKITKAGLHWTRITTQPAAGHITKSGSVYLSLLLTGAYPGHNDFDVKAVRLQVSVIRLK